MLKIEDLENCKEAQRKFVEHEAKYPNGDISLYFEIMTKFNEEIERLEKLQEIN